MPAKKRAYCREYQREYRQRPEVKERLRAYQRDYYQRPEVKARRRAHQLRGRFDITTEEYERLLAAQNGCCAVCGNPCGTGRRLAVDHDHDTGDIRGLLCGNCNRGIGNLKDDPAALRRAAAYLEEHNHAETS